MVRCVLIAPEVFYAVPFFTSRCLAKGVGALQKVVASSNVQWWEVAICSRLGVSICEAHYSHCSILLLWFERKDALCRLHGLENGGASVMVIEGEKKKRLREGERGMKGIVRE